MSAHTISEDLFEQLCARKGVAYARIPTNSAKSADYRLTLGRVTLIAEVKQLDPRPEDLSMAKTWGTRQSAGANAPSNRVQGLLDDGYPQIKESAEGKWPAMIVVYNNSGVWNFIDSFTISKAMFGTFGIVMVLRSDQTIGVAGHGYMGERRTTKNMYRALSVVGVLQRAQADALALECYHNPFATFQVDRTVLSALSDDQFIHPNPHDRGYIPWQPIKIE